MNDNGVRALVDQIDEALAQLATMIADPHMAHFDVLHPAFEKLEQVFTRKTSLDAAFAYAADLNKAGFKVGSSRVVDYLMQALDLTRAEANARLRRGRALYDPPAPPPPDPEPEEARGDDSAEDLARKKAEAERKLRERIDREERERKAQEEARRRDASEAKRKIIDTELKGLHEAADPGFSQLLNRALEYAEHHSAEDLTQWLREQVRKANASVPGPKRFNTAFNKRYISFGEPDADGGVRVHGYLPGDMAAVLYEALNPARTNSLDVLEGTDLATTENMSMGAKRAHLLTGMARDFLNRKELNLRGVGSIVVSLTLDQLENMTPEDLFPTNTGHLVDPFGIVRLGEARSDAFVLHANNGHPLHVDTGKRTASMYHRLALFASELVCSTPGCDRPATDCQAHHIVPYSKGGATALDFLTQLCWGHHQDNNDARAPSGLGWAERDEETGRVGFRRRAHEPIRFNESAAARRSAAARIRARHAQTTTPEPATPDGLFDAPL